MDSPQSVVSPFKTLIMMEPEKLRSGCAVTGSDGLLKVIDFSRNEAAVTDSGALVGVIKVYIHHARDIQNICIYHKQDVYAKLCLTSDPEETVATKIINGGGRNPVFEDNVQLNVRTLDCSLKCEIYMMSRVKNYLEDQLLGFALVPLSEVVIQDGKLEKEFSLSSTDLFHSPAGFVQLSLSYNGASPEVLALPSAPPANGSIQDTEIQESVPGEYDNIEFPDPSIMNETRKMVSEYFGVPCINLDSETCESFVTCNSDDHLDSESGVRLVESFSAATVESDQAHKVDSPPSSVSTNGVSYSSAAASPDAGAAAESANRENGSPQREKLVDVADGDSNSSGGTPNYETLVKPLITVNKVPDSNVVQQDIVDMYMKSMQQFTESLAKMKLPLDTEPGPTSSGSSSSDPKLQTSKSDNSRVFYGSRAFF